MTLSPKSSEPQKVDFGNDNATFIDISHWHQKLKKLDEKQLYEDIIKKKVFGVDATTNCQLGQTRRALSFGGK